MFVLGHWSLCFCCFCSKIFLGKSVSWLVVKHVSLKKTYSARSVYIRFGSLKKKISYMSFLFSPDTWSLKVIVFVILDIWLQE